MAHNSIFQSMSVLRYQGSTKKYIVPLLVFMGCCSLISHICLICVDISLNAGVYS